jgi:hypothetical protein
VRAGIAALGLAAALAALASGCGASSGDKVHGVETGDPKAVAGAYVLDWIVCSHDSIERQYDFLAKPPKDKAAYVSDVLGTCEPRGPAKLEQTIVSENGKQRVVQVDFVTGKGSGGTQVHVTNGDKGYRVSKPVDFASVKVTPPSAS